MAETDFSYLDDLTINQLKELDAAIHERLGITESPCSVSVMPIQEESIQTNSKLEYVDYEYLNKGCFYSEADVYYGRTLALNFNYTNGNNTPCRYSDDFKISVYQNGAEVNQTRASLSQKALPVSATNRYNTVLKDGKVLIGEVYTIGDFSPLTVIITADHGKTTVNTFTTAAGMTICPLPRLSALSPDRLTRKGRAVDPVLGLIIEEKDFHNLDLRESSRMEYIPGGRFPHTMTVGNARELTDPA